MYGAGNLKLGLSIDPTLTEAKAKRLGKQVRGDFINAIPGLEKLLNAVKRAAEVRGAVKVLDGRLIDVDSPHKALNYLLQASAGIVAKEWVVLSNSNPDVQKGLAHQVGFIHDEVVFDCTRGFEQPLSEYIEESARVAGQIYHLNIPIAASASVGNSWADIH